MGSVRIGKVAKINQKVVEPSSGTDLFGMKGVVRVFYDADPEDPNDQDMALIEWTPETLDQLPPKHFYSALENEENWGSAAVPLALLEETEDTFDEFEMAWKRQEKFTRFIMGRLGREGRMIAKVFEKPADPTKVTPDNCWYEAIAPFLTRPQRVTACYPYEEGDGPIKEGDRLTLTALNGIDPSLGILAEVEREGVPLIVPLQDLLGEDNSKTGRTINAYGLWKAFSA